MNARGSTEVIVATIGLTMGVLSQNLFTLIVTMAVITTLSMPPMLRWSLRRLPMSRKERQRLEREELDARGFVNNLERLLLATDDSANGKFGAWLAGVIGGSGGKPTTVLELRNGKKRNGAAKADAAATNGSGTRIGGATREREVKNAAETVMTLEAHPDEERPGSVDVVRRSHDADAGEAVAGEARKGHDFLIIGVAKTHNPKGGFSKDVSQIANGFDGALAVVDFHKGPAAYRERGGRILVPINGTEVSRRAAEIALTLARATDAHVTALYVTRALPSGDPHRKAAMRRNEQAVLRDIAALADRYEVTVRSATRSNVAPDEAILREAKRGYDLIVLGVSRRPGDTLFFGNTATAVLDQSETSNLFVAS
jgi:K+:H+ antiporter